MPRKSALRNGSRSPSPLAGPKSTEAAPRLPAKSPLAHTPRPIPTTAPPAPAPPATLPNGEAKADSSSDEDNDSVASYATGLEDLPEEGPGDANSGSGIGSSTSTATATGTGKDKDGAPKRRKRVRLSLPPTFSQTPPALDSEAYGPEETWEDDGKRKQGGDRAKERKEKKGAQA